MSQITVSANETFADSTSISCQRCGMQLHHFLALSFSLTKVASPAPALPNDISGARAFRTQKFHSPAVKINDLIQCRLAETGDREELLDIQQWQHNFQGDPPSHAIKTVRQLGSGLSGEVFQVLLDGGTYALKALWQTWTTEMFTKEYWLMHYYQTHLSKQDRSNLIELRAGVWVDITMQHELEFIVMEYADQGTLEDLLLKRPSLSTTVRIDLITGLVSAIRNLHKIGVAHRDLKPDNVLIQSTDGGQLVLKVADFGSARLLDPNFSDRFARFCESSSDSYAFSKS